jgi:hypothetical protein
MMEPLNKLRTLFAEGDAPGDGIGQRRVRRPHLIGVKNARKHRAPFRELNDSVKPKVFFKPVIF